MSLHRINEPIRLGIYKNKETGVVVQVVDVLSVPDAVDYKPWPRKEPIEPSQCPTFLFMERFVSVGSVAVMERHQRKE